MPPPLLLLLLLLLPIGLGACASTRAVAPATPTVSAATPPIAPVGPGGPVIPVVAPAATGGVRLEPARFVLVRAGAFFHTALPPAGRRARHATATTTATTTDDAIAPRTSARFRLIRPVGDWVEIESISADADHPHCHGPSTLFTGLAVRLFVAATDLQPVTTRRVRVSVGDGSVDLEPGVPVVRDGARWKAYPDDNPLPVDLAIDAVGTSYVPAPDRPIAAQHQVLAPDTAIAIGGIELKVDGSRPPGGAGAPGAGRDRPQAASVQQATPGPAGRMGVQVQTFCAVYAGTVSASAIQDAQPPEKGGFALPRLDRNRFTARAGAPLLWADGTAAGRIVANVPIADDANPDRQHPCFDWMLGPRDAEGESALRICLAAADLIESPAFLSDQQVAVVTPRTHRQVTLAIDNQTARSNPEVDGAARQAARRRLFALGDLVLVPPGEDPAISASRAVRNGLVRYTLKVSIEETLGASGQMSTRRVATDLVRLDGAAQGLKDGHPDGHRIGSAQTQQFQSARSAAEEADALDELLDGAMQATADSLRGDP